MTSIKVYVQTTETIILVDEFQCPSDDINDIHIKTKDFVHSTRLFSSYVIYEAEDGERSFIGIPNKFGRFILSAMSWYPKYTKNIRKCLKFVVADIDEVVFRHISGTVSKDSGDIFEDFYTFFLEIEELNRSDKTRHLNYAISCGDLNKVKIILKLIGNIKETERSPLSTAISSKHTDIFIYLIETGRFSANHKNSFGMTPLHYAAEVNDVMAIKKLLEFGADPISTNYMNQMPIGLGKVYVNIDAVLALEEATNDALNNNLRYCLFRAAGMNEFPRGNGNVRGAVPVDLFNLVNKQEMTI